MLKLKILICFLFCSSLISFASKDISMKRIRNRYNSSLLASSASWVISVNKLVAPGKYSRMTFSYELNGKKEKVQFILNRPKYPKIKHISVYITRIDDYPATLFISTMPYAVYKKRLLEKTEKFVNFYPVNDLSFDLGKEIILGRTFSTDPRMKPGIHKEGGSTVLVPPPVVSIELKVKVEQVDSPEMYLLAKDLRPNLKGLGLQQQYDWIDKEFKKREHLYRIRQATIEDLNLILTYKCIVQDKMKAAGIRIPDQKPKKLQRTRPLKVQSIKLQSIN